MYWQQTGTMTGFHGNADETSGSAETGNFLNYSGDIFN
jgi:hypothetical protein